jgi:hypothetical protein
MRSSALIMTTIVLLTVIIGCATGSNLNKYTQAQLTALTTREVNATFTEAYQAATDALFDAGYTIAESDRQGGILTGYQRDDRSSERFWISYAIQDTEFRISILLRERTPNLIAVRLSTSVNGEPYIKEKAIDEFWRLMNRQVLLQEPPPLPQDDSVSQ